MSPGQARPGFSLFSLFIPGPVIHSVSSLPSGNSTHLRLIPSSTPQLLNPGLSSTTRQFVESPTPRLYSWPSVFDSSMPVFVLNLVSLLPWYPAPPATLNPPPRLSNKVLRTSRPSCVCRAFGSSVQPCHIVVWLGEGGLDSVEEGHCVRDDTVERQSTCLVIQVH